MGLKNGHILLISTMSWFQLLYDVSFFNAVIHVGNDGIYAAANVAQEVGGISSSLISNFIALISLYVVKNTKSIDVSRYYPFIVVSVLIPSAVDAAMYIISYTDGYGHLREISTMYVYYYIRLASIAVNFVVSFQTAWQISKISNRTGNGQRTIHEKAIRTLSMRLIYYPIIQAVSRSGSAWYEMQYKFDFDPTERVSRTQFVAQCFMALLTPSASYGYLVIFLLMQPNAWECLMATLCCRVYAPKMVNNIPSKFTNGGGPIIKSSSHSNFNNLSGLSSLGGLNSPSGPSAYTGLNHDDLTSAYDEDQSLGGESHCSSVYYTFSDKDDDELWSLIGKYDQHNVPRDHKTDDNQYDYALSQSLLYGHN
jgi:hypothetical protein